MALKFVNHILDNVHGFIGLTEVENKIEQLPIFKRLQHIKQLGLANWIFPGAEHTRYIHSLGVMHIIDQMSIKLNFSDEDRQLVRLAGMLHDIGHYPLSHIGEYAYKQKAVTCQDILRTSQQDIIDGICGINNKKILNSVMMQGQANPFHHENIAVKVIYNSSEILDLLSTHCRYIDVQDICDIITGNTARIEMKPDLSAKIQLLHSELDADRIDYLLRDATFSGASYGRFELGTLLKNLDVKRHSELKLDIVGVKFKGIGSADQFLVNRYLAYSQVIFHKHVAILGFMARTVMKWMIEERAFTDFPDNNTFNYYVLNHEKNSAFLEFTDQHFLNCLYKINKESHGCPDGIYKIVENLRRFKALDLSDRQVAFSGNDRNKIVTDIKDTALYQRIIKSDYPQTESIPLFHLLAVTSNVPLETFKQAYNESKTGEDTPEFDFYLKHRLQNGLAIIEENSEPYLLVDSHYSLTKDLCNNVLVILREYSLN